MGNDTFLLDLKRHAPPFPSLTVQLVSIMLAAMQARSSGDEHAGGAARG
jgi:hypothetical protein